MAERAELETKLFALLVRAIDAASRMYAIEQYSVFDDDFDSELGECLSALGYLKLMWPLPQIPFDAQILKHIVDVFTEFDAVCPAPILPTFKASHSSGRHSLSARNIQLTMRCRLACDAIVDVATM
jgi:hypothetical protein